MSEKIDGITERLSKQADAELKERIEKAGKAFFDFLGDGYPHRLVTVEVELKKEVTVYWRETWRNMKALAFEVNKNRNREEKISAFMEKVERLDAQLAELRDSVRGPNLET